MEYLDRSAKKSIVSWVLIWINCQVCSPHFEQWHLASSLSVFKSPKTFASHLTEWSLSRPSSPWLSTAVYTDPIGESPCLHITRYPAFNNCDHSRRRTRRTIFDNKWCLSHSQTRCWWRQSTDCFRCLRKIQARCWSKNLPFYLCNKISLLWPW